ncbi:MAG TPA: hypothetical protein VKH81_25450 [Candidatus Angelobacter sp.]|nr:hypothetical protein [Candidatus Angelobacter sp.]
MKRISILVFLLACSLAAAAEPLKGIVQNSTTNKPSVGDEVTLKRIGNGMEDVGKTKTNGKGEFSFNVPATPQPYVVWVEHQGVTYTARAIPGGSPVAVRVFDAAPSLKEISILEHAMVFHSGDKSDVLIGEEIYTVGNNSTPPRTLMNDRTFEFYLPEGVTITESSVRTSSGTELKTPAIPGGEKNKYGFKFPIRPGETQFHVIYNLPYSGSLKVDPKSALATRSLMVVAPGSMKFEPVDKSLYQLKPNPQFPGLNFYVAMNVASQQQTGFEISGTGALPEEQQASGGQGQAGDNRPGGGLGVPNEMPDPLRSGQWVFLGVLSLFLAAGAVYVFTTNQRAVVAVGGSAKTKDRAGMLMEAMKEEVFQLESDRLQGKISPEDYQTAKAALDKTLQRAVQRSSAGKGK